MLLLTTASSSSFSSLVLLHGREQNRTEQKTEKEQNQPSSSILLCLLLAAAGTPIFVSIKRTTRGVGKNVAAVAAKPMVHILPHSSIHWLSLNVTNFKFPNTSEIDQSIDRDHE